MFCTPVKFIADLDSASDAWGPQMISSMARQSHVCAQECYGQSSRVQSSHPQSDGFGSQNHWPASTSECGALSNHRSRMPRADWCGTGLRMPPSWERFHARSVPAPLRCRSRARRFPRTGSDRPREGRCRTGRSRSPPNPRPPEVSGRSTRSASSTTSPLP